VKTISTASHSKSDDSGQPQKDSPPSRTVVPATPTPCNGNCVSAHALRRISSSILPELLEMRARLEELINAIESQQANT
jgi:hypothetical protein